MKERGYGTALFGKSGFYIYDRQGSKFKKPKVYDVEVGQKDLYNNGCSDWNNSARIPPMNIEASAWTRRMGASSSNHPGSFVSKSSAWRTSA